MSSHINFLSARRLKIAVTTRFLKFLVNRSGKSSLGSSRAS